MVPQETISTLSTAFRQLSDALHSASVACKDLEYIIPQLAASQTSTSAPIVGTAQPPAQPPSQEKQAKRVRDPNEPRRPPSAYLLFTSRARADLVKNNPDLKATEVVSKLAGLWNELTESEKKPYEQEAEQLKEVYDKEREKYERENPNAPKFKRRRASVSGKETSTPGKTLPSPDASPAVQPAPKETPKATPAKDKSKKDKSPKSERKDKSKDKDKDKKRRKSEGKTA